MKRALVCGAGGFIGGHLVARLKSEGYWVRGVDIKEHEYRETGADEFLVLDLRSEKNVHAAFDGGFDEVYQLAADMGGAGYIFTGEHDADVMHNSAMINLNVAKIASECEDMPVVFYSSSACMYPEHNQMDPDNPNCAEDSAYPADPDSEYGWAKKKPPLQSVVKLQRRVKEEKLRFGAMACKLDHSCMSMSVLKVSVD